MNSDTQKFFSLAAVVVAAILFGMVLAGAINVTPPADADPPAPVLAAPMQELFGSADTPRIFDGRLPLLLHLLSPAGRPLQITRDLAGFWRSAYTEVRKEMRGRYPKHHWPEDPAASSAIAGGLKRRLREP